MILSLTTTILKFNSIVGGGGVRGLNVEGADGRGLNVGG